MSLHEGDDGVSIAIPEINIQALPLRCQINLLRPCTQAKGELEVDQGNDILDDILIGGSPFRRIVQDMHNFTTCLRRNRNVGRGRGVGLDQRIR